MAQSKYKRHSRGGRFRQQGEGSRAAVDNIRQQRQIEIDALKTQALQQKERDSLQISGLRNVAKSEAENRNILQDLENKIYQNKRNAISVRSQTEVESILGQAKELGKEAEFWEEFATKHSKELGKAASGLYNFAQYRAAIKAYESQSEKEKDSAEALHESSYDIVKKEGDAAVIQIEDLSKKKDTIRSVTGFANNAHYHRMLQKDLFETLNAHIDLARGYTAEDGTVLFTKDTATQIILNLGYNYCFTHDIPLNSAAGRKIMNKLKQQAVIETAKLTKSHHYKEDDAGLRELAKVAATNYMNIDDPAYHINDEGKKVFATSEFDGKVKNWIVSGTGKKKFRVASGKERFHDSLYDLYTAYKGSYTLGRNGILAPGDAARLAETPKHVWTEVLKKVIDSSNFKTKADAIHYLNIPVRDKNGKIVYKKDGVTPAEFLLDKLPDLKQEVEEHWDRNNNKSVTEKDLKENANAKAIFADFDAQIEKDATFKNEKGELVPYKNTLNDQVFMTELIETAHKYKDHPAAKKFLDLTPIDEYLTDNRNKNQKIIAGGFLVMQEYSKGDIQGALFQYVKIGEHLPGLANLLEATRTARAVPDFSNLTKKFIETELKSGINLTGLAETKVANSDDFNTMVDRGVGRFMTVWASLTDIENPQKRFDEAKKILKEEIELGLEKEKGMFAATEIKSGGLRRGWTFHSLEGSKETLKELDGNSVVSLYTEVGFDKDSIKSLVTSTDAKEQNESIKQVAYVLSENLNKLMTANDARNLLGLIVTGQVDATDIPPNLQTFIGITKGELGYQVTTRDIMNMTVRIIQENGDKMWKDKEIDVQFDGSDWPVGTEDLVKATCGVVPRHKKDEIGLTCKQLFENAGLDINQTLIERYLKLKGVK